MHKIFFLSFLIIYNLQAVFVGNPSSPSLYNRGIFSSLERWGSVRVGYVTDFIYKSRCKDEFKQEDSVPMDNELFSYFGVLTFNLFSRIDLYGFIGQTRFNINDEVYPDKDLSWGFGTKILLLKCRCVDFGIDAKYFTTCQKPTFFVVDGMLAPLETKLHYDYEEMQAALLLSYKSYPFIPYMGLSYLYCRLSPNVRKGLIELPAHNMFVDFYTRSSVSRNTWGYMLGLTLISKKTITFTIESRFFDQNAINGSLEFRF